LKSLSSKAPKYCGKDYFQDKQRVSALCTKQQNQWDKKSATQG